MRGLVLEGGGAKGAYQIGAIKAFKKKGIKFDGVVGTSIGSINAAFLASNNFNGAYKLWLGTDSKYIFGIETDILRAISTRNFTLDIIKRGLKTVSSIIKTNGVDIKNMKKLLTSNINESNLRKSNMDYGLVTYDMTDMKPVEIFKDDIPEGKLIEYIIASSYLPLFRYEKIINEKYYMDGGVYSRCPVDMLIKKKYDEIYVVKAYTNKVDYSKKRGVSVKVITPKKNLGLEIDFYEEAAQRNIKLGYFDTLKYLDKLDGKEYYFKSYDEKYYTHLFDTAIRNKMIKKYSNALIIKSNKDFILRIIERACKELNINKFKVYDIPYLLTKIKFKILADKNNVYYDFFKHIKVNF